jgi:hypothetical protein
MESKKKNINLKCYRKKPKKKEKIKLFKIIRVMFKTNNGFYRNEKKKKGTQTPIE